MVLSDNNTKSKIKHTHESISIWDSDAPSPENLHIKEKSEHLIKSKNSECSHKSDKKRNKSSEHVSIKSVSSGDSTKKSDAKNASSQTPKKSADMNSLEKLYAFMRKFKNESKKKTGKNLPWTHAMTHEPYGSYNISDDQYPAFLRLYENAVVDGYMPHITEKHKEFGPIVIDLDFVHSKEHSKRYYTERTMRNIIKLYNKVIKEYLDVSNNKLDAYVSEKKKPNLRNNEYHDGIHIVYPYLCTKPSLQLLMREEFLKMANDHKIFNKLHLINSPDDVFDKNVIYHTGWMLYGSRKNPACDVYRVTHIYQSANNKILDILPPREDITRRTLVRHFIDLMSCRRFFDDRSLVSVLDPVVVDKKVDKIRDRISSEASDKKSVKKVMGNDIHFIKVVPEDIYVEAKNLVKLFSRERSSQWHSWYQVGRCLHNIDYRLLEDWIEFSKKTIRDNFKKGECEMLWKKMKSSNYTMATLHYFASHDNPKKYKKMKKEKLDTLLHNGMEASHNTIAKLIMEKYKFMYRCASVKHNLWYEFKNHRWVEIDSAYSLRNLISDDLTKEYAKKQAYLYESSNEKQGYDKEKCIGEATYISKVIKQLNNANFKNGVIQECAAISYDPTFLRNLDENQYFICFENGIYDLEIDHFRDGCPDDYISLCTGYNYVEYDKNDQVAADIKDFLHKIQTDKIMRTYLMKLLSTCLAGSVGEESFYVFTGSGANGKSKLMELLRYTLGDYFKPMDIRLLTEKRSSSASASPEVADKKGIRACTLDEPKATDEINTGFMKLFTGGDPIPARALYKEPIYFKPQFKPFLLCNHLPNIKSDDDGTWRRLKVIPFLSKFIKPSDSTKRQAKHGLGKDEFWADTSLSEKLQDWKQIFMGMLIQNYHKYKIEGLVHPKLVTQFTNDYRKRCDIFQDFIGDYLEKTNNPKDTVSISTLHEGMRSWHRANYDGKPPNTKEMRNYMQNKVAAFNSKTDSLAGYKIKTSNEEDGLDELEGLGK